MIIDLLIERHKHNERQGGYLAVSEASWITDSRPAELETYWMQEYPGIDTVPNQLNMIVSTGFIPEAHFILPEHCWGDNYYKPLQESQETFLTTHGYSKDARELIEAEKKEIEIFNRFHAYYSYGFFIARKLEKQKQ